MAPEEDGIPLIEHLKAAEKRTGVTPAALLAAPPCPAGCETVWNVFYDLHSTRSSGFGPGRISFTEIDAYQRVMRISLAPWEIEAVRRVDRAFMADWNSRQPKPDA